MLLPCPISVRVTRCSMTLMMRIMPSCPATANSGSSLCGSSDHAQQKYDSDRSSSTYTCLVHGGWFFADRGARSVGQGFKTRNPIYPHLANFDVSVREQLVDRGSVRAGRGEQVVASVIVQVDRQPEQHLQ